MPRYRTAYAPEFRRQMVDLVRSGRTPEELAREFAVTRLSPGLCRAKASPDL
jgi:transposase